MQNNDMIRKIVINVEGNQLGDLIKFGEIFIEDISVEIPSLKKIVTILAGINKINPVICAFKLQRNSITENFIRSWVEDREVKDISVIEVDGTGIEYGRILLKDCEAGNIKLPEYDATSPTFAQLEVTFYPYDILELE